MWLSADMNFGSMVKHDSVKALDDLGMSCEKCSLMAADFLKWRQKCQCSFYKCEWNDQLKCLD